MSELQQTAAPIRYCTFCGGHQHERKLLISGPAVFICNECLELCMDLEQQRADVVAESGYINRDVVAFVLWLNGTPEMWQASARGGIVVSGGSQVSIGSVFSIDMRNTR